MSDSTHERVNIVSIAKVLGVSKSTVHAALKGTPTVRESTRQRVLQAAESLGYRKNLVASALRTQKSGTIGLLTAQLQWQLHGATCQALDAVAAQAGYTLIQGTSQTRPEREQLLLEHFVGWSAEGIIIVGPTQNHHTAVAAYTALARQIPLLFIESIPEGVPADYADIDNYLSGRLATEYLLGRGRRHIVYFAPMGTDRYSWWVHDRLHGCTDTLRAVGAPDPVCVTGSPLGEVDIPTSRAALDAVLDQGMSFDGLIAANDHLAYSAMAALQARGLRVPDDVAVIGHDDMIQPRPNLPALTTLKYPFDAVGERGMTLLLRRIRGEENCPPQQVLVPPTLIVRESA